MSPTLSGQMSAPYLQSKGFTLIELLMVILLVGMLNVALLPAMIDFRNEAKVASLHQSLTAIRTGVKLQLLQAKIRCGYISNPNTIFFGGQTMHYYLFSAMRFNDITLWEGQPPEICTSSQIPNPTERRFWDVGTMDTSYEMPRNPFVLSSIIDRPTILALSDSFIANLGKCGWATAFGGNIHWIGNTTTGEIFPGTNTAGINECNF